MKPSLATDPAPVGLRERKKAKTRAAIQEHALRLFQQQGYEATTVEQIAAAAEISPSTFFRYFPTKEDVVIYDALDPLLFEAFRAQPAGLSPIAALRGALHEVYDRLPAVELAKEQERAELILREPALRMRAVDDFIGTFEVFAQMLAARVGRPPDDLTVWATVGAVIGAMLGVWLAGPVTLAPDYYAKVDAALTELESGLLLGTTPAAAPPP